MSTNVVAENKKDCWNQSRLL